MGRPNDLFDLFRSEPHRIYEPEGDMRLTMVEALFAICARFRWELDRGEWGDCREMAAFLAEVRYSAGMSKRFPCGDNFFEAVVAEMSYGEVMRAARLISYVENRWPRRW